MALPRGLGARLVVAQILVAAMILAVAGLGLTRVRTAERRLLRVYDHRITPLQRLQEVTDLFAIDFVDAVHKVSDRSLDARRGVLALESVQNQSEAKWRAAEELMTTEQERPVLERIRPAFLRAQSGLAEARDLMAQGEIQPLRNWRATNLYTRVDPLTADLHALIDGALEFAHADVLSLRQDLAHSARESAVALVIADDQHDVGPLNAKQRPRRVFRGR